MITKEEIIERLIKDNSITFKEALILITHQNFIYVRDINYKPSEQWINPWDVTCYNK